MPARNLVHDAVVDALRADGWSITADPLHLLIGRRRLFVDLAGERAAFAANRNEERIAVEVQSFLSNSEIDDFHRAIGQFIVYRAVLSAVDTGRILYLAVADEVYTGIMSEPIGQLVLADIGAKLIVFQPATRRIIQWIN